MLNIYEHIMFGRRFLSLITESIYCQLHNPNNIRIHPLNTFDATHYCRM